MGYLTRSLSAMYALHGALVFLVSLDVRRFLPVVKCFVRLDGCKIASSIIPWCFSAQKHNRFEVKLFFQFLRNVRLLPAFYYPVSN